MQRLKLNKRLKRFQFGSGFTLIEILLVVVIIGVLVSVISVSAGVGRTKARDARRKEDLRQLQAGIETYFQTTRTYPGMVASWSAQEALESILVPSHLVAIPRDPRGQAWDAFYAYQAAAASGNIIQPAPGTINYRLIAAIESTEDVDQPTTSCNELIITGQYPPFCSLNGTDYTLIQTGGAVWDEATWKAKSF